MQRLPGSEWREEITTRIEEYAVASQILKEQGVPGLHRLVRKQHIDFMQGIKVKCVCIDDVDKDVFPIRPDESIGCVKDGA